MPAASWLPMACYLYACPGLTQPSGLTAACLPSVAMVGHVLKVTNTGCTSWASTTGVYCRLPDCLSVPYLSTASGIEHPATPLLTSTQQLLCNRPRASLQLCRALSMHGQCPTAKVDIDIKTSEAWYKIPGTNIVLHLRHSAVISRRTTPWLTELATRLSNPHYVVLATAAATGWLFCCCQDLDLLLYNLGCPDTRQTVHCQWPDT